MPLSFKIVTKLLQQNVSYYAISIFLSFHAFILKLNFYFQVKGVIPFYYKFGIT